jgi:hypothetical protein
MVAGGGITDYFGKQESWTKIGVVRPESRFVAKKAFEEMMGDNELAVEKRVAYYLENESELYLDTGEPNPNFVPKVEPTDAFNIMVRRGDTPFHVIDTVSDAWYLVTPDVAVDVWDRAVERATGMWQGFEYDGVQSMILTQGRKGVPTGIAITTKMPDTVYTGKVGEVEHHAHWAILHVPFTSKSKIGTYLSDVRVQCINTLNAAIGSANSSVRFTHYDKVHHDVENMLVEILGGMEKEIDLQKQLTERLIMMDIFDKEDYNTYIRAMYPIPGEPRDGGYKRSYSKRLSRWETDVERTALVRKALEKMWDEPDKMIGGLTEGFEHTAYHALQSVLQVETHKSTMSKTAATSLLFGDRAAVTNKANNILQDWIDIGDIDDALKKQKISVPSEESDLRLIEKALG